MKSPFAYISNLFKGANGGRRGSSGRGFDVTQSSRTRRALGLIAGLVAAADYHLNKQTLGQLRELCRMHDRRSALFSGLLDRAKDNIFGANFNFIPNTGDSDLNKRAEDYIGKRMEKEYCDASGVNGFDDLAKLGLRAVWNDGDFDWVKINDGSVMAFEADQIVTPDNYTPGSKKIITLGVEKDANNRHIAHHIKQRGKTGDYGYSSERLETKRVPASHIICPAFRKRYNQTRGLPFLAAALGYFSRFNSYLDFESLAAEGNAMLGYKITKKTIENTNTNPKPGQVDNPKTESTFDKLQKMEPFMIFELLENEDIGMIGSERPGDNFEPYVVTCCRIIGVAVGYPLELMMLDFSRTNYSSARASMGEARRSFRGWQKFCQEQLCLPWYRWQMSRGIASGELPANSEIFKARCQWPAWEYIDPMKAAKGDAIAISTGTKSRSECIRQRGAEPAEVFQEIHDENEKMVELGIILPPATLSVTTDESGEKEDSEKESK